MDDLSENTRGIALTVLESLVPDEQPGGESDLDVNAEHDPLKCSVAIDGEWSGNVIVSVTPRLASWIARRMFGQSAATASAQAQDRRDAVREVSNIVAGNIKPLLGVGNTLGLPVDLSGDHPLPTTALSHVTVDRHGESLEIHVLQAA